MSLLSPAEIIFASARSYPSIAAATKEKPLWMTAQGWFAAFALVFFAVNGRFSFDATADNSALGAMGSVDTSSSSGHTLLAFQLAAMAIICGLALPYVKSIMRTLWSVPSLAALTLLPIASVLWSSDKYASFKSAVFLVFTVAFAAWIVVALSYHRQFQLLWMTAVICISLTIAVSVFLPEYGIDYRTGRGGEWEGIFAGKNVCAYVMGFFLTSCTYPLAKTTFWLICRSVTVLSLLMIIGMTRSKAAWVITLAYFLFRLSLSALGKFGSKSKTAIVFAATILIIPIISLIVANAEGLLRFIGRDLSFSGRTQIWSALWLSILKRPVLGYGFRAFWSNRESINVMLSIHHTMAYAHNGFLGIAVELGLVSVVLICICFFDAAKNASRCFRPDRPPSVDWYISVVLITLLYNFTEATFVFPLSLTWLLFTAACLGLKREALSSKLLTYPSLSYK